MSERLAKAIFAIFFLIPWALTAQAGSNPVVTIGAPEQALRPGDILLFPFPPEKATSHPEVPAAYRAALGKFRHASIVAADPTGALYRLEAPYLPVPAAYELRIPEPYFILRPRLRNGEARPQFEKHVNRYALHFAQLGYGYDTLMTPTFLDTPKMADLRARIDGGGPTPLPSQYCSGLTQTIEELSGAELARPVTLDDMLDLAIARIKRDAAKADGPLEGDRLHPAAEAVVDDIIRMFIELPERSIAEARKEMERMEREHAPAAELVRIKGWIAGQEHRIAQFKSARGILAMLVRQKLAGANRQTPIVGRLLGRKIIRPEDIWAETLRGQDGNYSLVGYYPGRRALAPVGRPHDPPVRAAATH